MKSINALLLVLVLGAFITPSAFAVTYYVKANGNDNADGLSDATAWRTLRKVSNTVRQSGADVMLRSGDVFQHQMLRVNWSGTADDPGVVGCYYMQNGRETPCTPAQAKPQITGTLNEACRRARNCIAETAAAVPPSQYGGLVTVVGHYITLQDILIRDSAGRGITADGRNLGGQMNGITIQRVEVRDTFFAPVILEHGIRHATVRDSLFRYFNWCEKNGRSDILAKCAHGAPWPSGLSLFNAKPSYSVIENNTVYAGAGEGINCDRCSHVVIRGNRVGNTHSSTIYVMHSNHVLVEKNIVWGNPNNGNAFHRGGESFSGIELGLEDFVVNERNRLAGGGSDNVIRNNLVTGHSFCIGSNSLMPASLAAGHSVGAKVYGNTCIGQRRASLHIHNAVAGAGNWDISNNIFYSPDASAPCQAPALDRIRFSHNVWDRTPAQQCRGADGSDRVGDPQFMLSATRFANTDYTNVPLRQAFAPRAGSIALNNGRDLSRLTVPSLSLNAWNGTERLLNTFSGSSCGSDFLPHALPVDFNCSQRAVPRPTIGAIESVADSVAIPPPMLMN